MSLYILRKSLLYLVFAVSFSTTKKPIVVLLTSSLLRLLTKIYTFQPEKRAVEWAGMLMPTAAVFVNISARCVQALSHC